MGIFSKDDAAKARRLQELDEQQKKKKAEPTPYVHTPTHALSDALLSVPHAYKATDKQRLKDAHRHRLEKEASALAAGLDNNATNIPAKYWQGQPLPAVFKAPSPASLAKSAIFDTWKGKKFEMPTIALRPKQEAQAPMDSGYASGLCRDNSGSSRRGNPNESRGSSLGPKRTRDLQAQAADEGEDDELERLRSKVRELESKQQGWQIDQGFAQQLPVLTKPTDQHAPSSNGQAVSPGSNLAPGKNACVASGTESRTSSSSALKSLDSKYFNRKKSEFTPSTSASDIDGAPWGPVDSYDWAIHWERLGATEQQRTKMPEASDPHGTRRKEAGNEPCYASLDAFCRELDSATTVKPSKVPETSDPQATWTPRSERGPLYASMDRFGSNSESSSTVRASNYRHRRPRNKTLERSEPGIADNSKSIKRPRARTPRRQANDMPSDSSFAEFDFGFDTATTSGRKSTTPTPSGDYPPEPKSQPGKVAAKRKHPYHGDDHKGSKTLIEF
ncbi:hypothetical protein diail_2402 [Diaporthe ilicicola]|nr:hypothetical protein diail_2402 [Diaporthe ilicicola]